VERAQSIEGYEPSQGLENVFTHIQ